MGVPGLLRLEVLHGHLPVVAGEVPQEDALHLVRELKHLLRISPHVNCSLTSSSPSDRCSVLVRGDSGDCTLSELLNGDLFTFSENLSVACCCSDTWDSEHFSSLVDSETHIVCISELFVQIVPSY